MSLVSFGKGERTRDEKGAKGGGEGVIRAITATPQPFEAQTAVSALRFFATPRIQETNQRPTPPDYSSRRQWVALWHSGVERAESKSSLKCHRRGVMTDLGSCTRT